MITASILPMLLLGTLGQGLDAGTASASAAPPDGGVSPSAPAAPPAAEAVAASAPPAPASAPLLPQVVVRARSLEDGLPGDLARNGTRIDTISSAQIANGGYVDVAQSLEALAPGLHISPKNGPFDYVGVSLQGSRTQDVLWLVDGVRINNRLYGGTTPLDTLPASIVERLEIIQGPQALFFGTQAVAGAINIVTRAFGDGPGGSIGLGADSSGGRHLDGHVRDSLGRHRLVVYGASDASQEYQSFRAQDYQPSAIDRRRGYEVLTLGGKYAYDLNDALRFSALYQHTDGRLDFARPFQLERAYNQRDEDILSAKVDASPRDGVDLYVRAYAHRWRSHFTELDTVVASGAADPRTVTVGDEQDFWGYRDTGANAMVKVALERALESFAGYDFQRYGGNDAVLVIREQSESVNAVFAQVQTAPGWLRDGNLAIGARYNLPSFGPAATVWSASGQYNLSSSLFSSLFVRGIVGTAFRLPTAEELFADDPNDERGDPDLRPERSFNVNLSVGGQLGGRSGDHQPTRLTWEVIGFFRNVTDLISGSGFDAATNQSLFENTSGTVHVRGGTLAIDTRLLRALSGSASYTYASAVSTGGLQIDGVPRQQAKAWLDFHPATLPFGLTLTANLVGASYRTFGDDDRERLDRHAVIDLAGRVFLDAERHHTITVRLANVFDARYPTALSKAVRDADGSSYTAWSLGIPRTLEARYGYRF